MIIINDNDYSNLYDKSNTTTTKLLRTIIFSLVNKNYYYIVILFLCYVSFLPLRFCIFLATLEYPWILNQSAFFQKKRKKKTPKIFKSMLCQMEKCNLFLSANFLLIDVLLILIHHFLLFFSIPSQCFYVGWTYILRGSLFIKVVSQ